jgi:hypothetical protein
MPHLNLSYFAGAVASPMNHRFKSEHEMLHIMRFQVPLPHVKVQIQTPDRLVEPETNRSRILSGRKEPMSDEKIGKGRMKWE